MQSGVVRLVVGGFLVLVLAGCHGGLAASGTAPTSALAASPTTGVQAVEIVRTRADVREVQVAARNAPAQGTVGARTPALASDVQWVPTQAGPCAPPCAPAPAPCCPPEPCCNWDGCGLPCAQGCASWHVRGVIGAAFAFGDETEEDAKLYYGGDIGWTSKCCWGIDVFYRGHCAEFDRSFPVIGATSFSGDDGGFWNHVGIKATYQSSFGNSRAYWFGGIGPQFYWTDDYLNDDDGIGGFAELGIGYVINENLKLRVAVEVLGQSTSIGRTNPADDGSDRWVFFVAPVASLEISL